MRECSEANARADLVEVLDSHRFHIDSVGLHGGLGGRVRPKVLGSCSGVKRFFDDDHVWVVLAAPETRAPDLIGEHLESLVVSGAEGFEVSDAAGAQDCGHFRASRSVVRVYDAGGASSDSGG